jgi:hypothetical protein
MKKRKEKTCWHKTKNIWINDELSINIDIEDNFYDIEIDSLFKMAARNNIKRRFLFVSKVLGKHIPCNPKKSLLVGYLLGFEFMRKFYGMENDMYKELSKAISINYDINSTYDKSLNNSFKLPEKILFLGFAETATALGHSVFSNFRGDCEYIHTTRENIINKTCTLSFEESHSHAVDHRIYGDNLNLLKENVPIVLIDDEITTGNTNINIIKQLHKIFPRKKYILMSILDWRSKVDIEKFKKLESDLDIDIKSISLVKGFISVNDNMKNEIINLADNFEKKDNKVNIEVNKIFIKSSLNRVEALTEYLDKTKNSYPYLEASGRFGIYENIQINLIKEAKKIGDLLYKLRRGGKTLCLGTGEFMYIPMLISANMGKEVYYHSTTRSPIIPDKSVSCYAINTCFSFKAIEDITYTNYLYNLYDNNYEDVFIFFEREIKDNIYKEIISIFNKVNNINIVIFSKSDFGGCSIDVEPF